MMYACLCNTLTEKDIQNLKKKCETKEEFIEELKRLFAKDSCMYCYTDVIGAFDR
jgi:bacterioferritin-associated ferredoxin|tara:strand:- start:361 stop:525 length:165 start_codon:yes stop_codon:yes gene_type:complete